MARKTIGITAIVLLMVVGLAFAGPAEIPSGAKCRLCGMVVEPASQYSAQIVQGGETVPFCDIGDLLVYYGRLAEKPTELYVRDSKDLKWIDAMKAHYVKGDAFKTPMEWGIAAFADREEAARHGAPMSFDEALQSVSAGGHKKMKMMH